MVHQTGGDTFDGGPPPYPFTAFYVIDPRSPFLRNRRVYIVQHLQNIQILQVLILQTITIITMKNPQDPRSLTSYLMPSDNVKMSRRQYRRYIKDIEEASEVQSNQDEVHACCVRLWFLFKKVQRENDKPYRFNRFCRRIGSDPISVLSYLLSLHTHNGYSASMPHRWACSLSKHWVKAYGLEVVIILFPNGTMLPTTWARPKH